MRVHLYSRGGLMVQLEALCSALNLLRLIHSSVSLRYSSFRTDPMPSREEMGLNQGQSWGKPQVFDWWPAEQQQYLNLTSRGQNNMSHTENAAAAASVHPLVPLLLYSDRHFSSSPYSQPISAAAAQQAYAQSEQHMCYHSNSASSRQPVKKPLNAFMLYMKEMRHKVLQEGQERESAAINRILGRRWHALSRSEQSKYYDLAQKERLLHMQLYPGWSARDNYGKRRKKQSHQTSGNSSSWTLNAG